MIIKLEKRVILRIRVTSSITLNRLDWSRESSPHVKIQFSSVHSTAFTGPTSSFVDIISTLESVETDLLHEQRFVNARNFRSRDGREGRGRACSCARRNERDCRRWRRTAVGRRRTRLKLNSAHGRASTNSCPTPSTVDPTACPSTRRARTPWKCRSWTWTISPVTARESASMWAVSFTFTFIKASER